ncbi:MULTISPECIES: bifunctional folylpolyglutamate synthase/dihydrofolate synthase [Paenibacillus]|uniref:tetrahydrofolate synthase n=1 Tax=Paenibacillus aceti TaxID=1820010 RepID=A0ABQ1W9J8_9BACL|nr:MULTISPECIES: folylpolyglutamate synthase/dihydrofolate synthase family protein [Paenibacillus]GGG18104.1 bifunctional folylpolyglutamate synthase/dihydrofolate synthase [Paenibacillus aceti]
MNYIETINYLESIEKFGIQPGLHRMHALLEEMGNPQKKLKYIHVAGTNGKGSTITFLNSILTESKYRIGVYTSPHIHKWNERIKVNNQYITDEEFSKVNSYVKNKVTILLQKGFEHPTTFEITTAAAFQFFYEKKCELVLLEAGLGGEFDATNVIDFAEVSIITKISFDHLDILGSTLREIARTKSGIIKEGTTLVLHSQDYEAENEIVKTVQNKNASLIKPNFDEIKVLKSDIEGFVFNYSNFTNLLITMLGEHQIRNAVIAINACLALNQKKDFKISDDDIRIGISKAYWLGRMEVINENPLVIIDGAHNEDGVANLVNSLSKYFPDQKIKFIIGVLQDKNYKKMIELILPIARSISTITPSNNRGLSSKVLAKCVEDQQFDDIDVFESMQEAIRSSLNSLGENEVICIMGSLYIIGEAREFFNK